MIHVHVRYDTMQVSVSRMHVFLFFRGPGLGKQIAKTRSEESFQAARATTSLHCARALDGGGEDTHEAKKIERRDFNNPGNET